MYRLCVHTTPLHTTRLHTHKHIYTCHAAHLSDNSSHSSEPFTLPSPLPPCRHRIDVCLLPARRPYHAAFVVSSDNYFWLLCNNFSAGTIPCQTPQPISILNSVLIQIHIAMAFASSLARQLPVVLMLGQTCEI